MVLDIVIVLFIILSAFAGYKKGLATILISFAGFVVALVLAFMFKGSLVTFVVEKTDVEVVMNQFVSEGINNAIQSKTNEITGGQNESFYSGLVKNMGVDQTVDNLSASVVNFILETAAFMLIFLVVSACAYILKMMFNIVFDLPILSTINSFGGLGLGALMAIFKIWIVLAILSMLAPMFGNVKVYIDSTVITKLLYDTNVIVKLLASGLKL